MQYRITQVNIQCIKYLCTVCTDTVVQIAYLVSGRLLYPIRVVHLVPCNPVHVAQLTPVQVAQLTPVQIANLSHLQEATWPLFMGSLPDLSLCYVSSGVAYLILVQVAHLTHILEQSSFTYFPQCHFEI